MTAPEVVRCGHCGRPLTDPDSRALGYGPVCAAGVLGYDTHRTPIPRGPRRRKDVNQIPLPLENPVDLETRKAAIDTIARHLVAAIVPPDLQAISYRDDYPALSEVDYAAVEKRAVQLAESLAPKDDAYAAAYEHLTGATVQEGQNA